MSALNNLKMSSKLIGSFILVSVIMAGMSVFSYFSMKSINDGMTSLYVDRTLPIQQVGAANTALYAIRGDVYKYILLPEMRPTVLQDMEKNINTINESIEKYRSSFMEEEEKVLLAAFDQAWADYQEKVDQVLVNVDAGNEAEALKSIADGGEGSNSRKQVGAAMQKIIELNAQLAEDISIQGDLTFTMAVRTLIIASIICVVLAISFGLVISRSITVPLGIAVNATKLLSTGDLVRDLSEKEKDKVRLRKDEIGDIGKAVDGLINYMQEMGKAASAIAQNDLTAAVSPRSSKDELGNAFSRMITGLRKTLSELAENAKNLSMASGQLAQAAGQAGQATNQISTTVQQVAKGTQDQAQSVTRTAVSVEQMSRAINGVAKGAQEQSLAVTKVSNITLQMTDAIQQVAGNAAAVTRDSAGAAQAARKGSETVEQTLEGMQSIKAKVGVSAEKVQDMGRRSDEIGTIVETIEDIASQTNLLALNAAIEAARAGEHGKGFAVVADEVRKLAERSSHATKEIGGLIKGIQKTVNEAVKAMEEGSKEVEAGVKSANQAGAALSEILNAAEAVNKQATQAAEAAERMTSASNELVASVDSVSAVIEENTAATEEMAANSSEVTQAIESIASVSEENSAAIEQVSASTEEMSAQVEEVTASAQTLAEMAQRLQLVVAQFKLS